MNEPSTVITDYLLGLVCSWVAFQLVRSDAKPQKLWAFAFAALAAGAFLGGTWHGFVQSDLLWKATVLSVGFASFGMVAGSGSVFSRTTRIALLMAASIKLVTYLGWMLFHDDFIYVVLDTGIALIAVAAIHLWKWNGPMLAGVALSVLAGAVQASGLKLHEHLNHNDLYHVIQTVAVLLLCQGAKRLRSS